MDNGDTIQGTALADYEATISPIPCTQQLSMYKAMGALGLTRARWATTSSTTACPS